MSTTPQHPSFLCGRLDESLRELARRIDHGYEKEALDHQLTRVQVILVELTISLQHNPNSTDADHWIESLRSKEKRPFILEPPYVDH